MKFKLTPSSPYIHFLSPPLTPYNINLQKTGWGYCSPLHTFLRYLIPTPPDQNGIALSWNMPKFNKETFLTSLENWLCKPYSYCMYSSINNKWIDLIRVTLGAMGIIIIFSLIYLLTDLFTYSNCQPSSRKYPVCVENLIKSVTLTRWPTLNYLYPLLLNCLL